MSKQIENQVKTEMNAEELQNNLQAAINQLRVLSQQNQALSKENEVYHMSDFYQRANWFWTIMKEGENVKLPTEFIENIRNLFVEMFTLAEEQTDDNKD
ncbi:MAG: hypothetical protein IJ180_11345 [Bacteroidales bacterium]|nr:hypothetical protein [Bacteroidales bacterium]MBQ9255351.1 hypothetical protein [Bacteroidales bacterium]